MKKCPKCKKEVTAKAKFCSNCGEELKTEKKSEKKTNETKKEKKTKKGKDFFNRVGDNIEKILETEDTSSDYKDEEIESYRGLAMLSYLGPFALIPYFKGKEHKYAYYHAVQGMNLLLVWVFYTIAAIMFYQIKVKESCTYVLGRKVGSCVSTTPWWIRFPFGVIGFMLFILSIIGIIYALWGKAKKLPLIDKVNIIK